LGEKRKKRGHKGQDFGQKENFGPEGITEIVLNGRGLRITRKKKIPGSRLEYIEEGLKKLRESVLTHETSAQSLQKELGGTEIGLRLWFSIGREIC